MPGERIGERLTRIKQLVSRPINPGGELVPLKRPDAMLATHPSDHNAYPIEGVDNLVAKRQEKVSKREKRERKKRGTVIDDHDLAFLSPLPIYSSSSDASIFSGGIANEFVWITVSLSLYRVRSA